MKKLLNTLFVLSEDAYLSLEGENVIISRGEETLGRFPLHTLESILCFSYKGASPALMGACASRGIGLAFFSARGRFLCRAQGETAGNVLLRREQFRRADELSSQIRIARNFLVGKILNERQVLKRALRDHPQRIDHPGFEGACERLAQLALEAGECSEADVLRGIEGSAAKQYFALFDQLILQNKEDFFFRERSRRPPLDRVNAALSFVYTLLAHDCASALEGVGLDAYVGFLHTDRPGRISLALDLMEELRPVLADRFVLSQINTRVINAKHFELYENGAVFLNDAGRKTVLSAWQERKRETILHPFTQEKMQWGLIPYMQALLLARHLREDLDAYPPFLWR